MVEGASTMVVVASTTVEAASTLVDAAPTLVVVTLTKRKTAFTAAIGAHRICAIFPLTGKITFAKKVSSIAVRRATHGVAAPGQKLIEPLGKG
jgi:hypothetical protein